MTLVHVEVVKSIKTAVVKMHNNNKVQLAVPLNLLIIPYYNII